LFGIGRGAGSRKVPIWYQPGPQASSELAVTFRPFVSPPFPGRYFRTTIAVAALYFARVPYLYRFFFARGLDFHYCRQLFCERE